MAIERIRYLPVRPAIRSVARALAGCVIITLMLFQGAVSEAENTIVTNDYENGWVRYRLSDYKGALKYWLSAASKGDTNAMVSAAHLYRTGQGVEQDLHKALKLYAGASSLGDVEAKHNLASMYFDGNGVKQDIERAVQLYKEAATQGYVKSQQQLGFISYNRKDYSEAAEWWSQAANKGDAESQYRLALLYLFGNGVAQDDKAALLLMHEAAKGGHPEAKKHYQRFLDINNGKTQPKE